MHILINNDHYFLFFFSDDGETLPFFGNMINTIKWNKPKYNKVKFKMNYKKST